MKCPVCDGPTRVRKTFPHRHPRIVYRRRYCKSEECGYSFRTWERFDPSQELVNGEARPRTRDRPGWPRHVPLPKPVDS